MTTIRNEQAYYCCIAQLLCTLPPLAVETAGGAAGGAATMGGDSGAPDERVLFVLGDSHSLAPAWRTLRPYGATPSVLLRPVLSTGTKAWHLREDTNFYPKVRRRVSLALDDVWLTLRQGRPTTKKHTVRRSLFLHPSSPALPRTSPII